MASPESASADPFDTLLGLEEQYYAEGHALGVADGSHAGRVEGRLFGMQKGFEKFAAMGALAGQAAIWEAKGVLASISTSSSADGGESAAGASFRKAGPGAVAWQASDKLDRHVTTLSALTEFATLDTQNTEEAVTEFDDRLKRAEAKAKVIASIVGEKGQGQGQGSTSTRKPAGTTASSNLEDFELPRAMRSTPR